MYKKESMFIYLLLITPFCFAQKYKRQENQEVGNIIFDSKFDDSNFKVCHPEQSYQYYNFSQGISPYKGEKYEILKLWQDSKKLSVNTNETGYITIRFLVNCEGKTGLFRVQQMDNNYMGSSFDKNFVEMILNFVKKLDGWKAAKYEGDDPKYKGKSFDYYQYLTFKIENGVVKEILP